MSDAEDRTPETDHPATWENVVVGKAKKLVGGALGDEELAEEGEEQEEVAREVSEEAGGRHRA